MYRYLLYRYLGLLYLGFLCLAGIPVAGTLPLLSTMKLILQRFCVLQYVVLLYRKLLAVAVFVVAETTGGGTVSVALLTRVAARVGVPALHNIREHTPFVLDTSPLFHPCHPSPICEVLPVDNQ